MENYFNYFTEIEEQFRKCRAEPVLLSPIDWALIESWKEQGFPLGAVLLGIERAFEKFKSGKRGYRKVNTLAYCSQEVFRAVETYRNILVGAVLILIVIFFPEGIMGKMAQWRERRDSPAVERKNA